jgi:HD-GYP domain-containing protein (c-di-GMP phosphodiesterase class II)
MAPGTGDIALSEVIGALSYALDVTEGQPPGHALRSCLIGMRLAEEIGLDARLRSDLFYALLLKDAGCSANAARMAALFGADDGEAKRTSKLVDWSRPLSALVWSLRTVDGSLRDRAERLGAIRAEGEVTRSLMQARCDRGAEIARMLFLSDGTAEAIRALDEHWDGRGQPAGLAGEEIPLLGRILCLAQTVEIFHAAGGVKAAWGVARRRSGRWFDPELVAAFGAIRRDREFWATLAQPDVSAWEPAGEVVAVDESRMDRIAEAFAHVIDAKSPFTARHSERVAEIAVGIGAVMGFGALGLRDLRRAALLHDIGKLAISNRILDKPAKLTDDEFALVREHPLYSLRILERAPCFASIAWIAATHHERLDGSGYPFGLGAEKLTRSMRALAVADVYEALTAERPYREALPVGRALEIVRGESPRGLDPDAVAALETFVAAPFDRPGAPQRASTSRPSNSTKSPPRSSNGAK